MSENLHTTGHHQPEQPSFPKIKLDAQLVGDFIDSPLKTNRIARRRNNRRLPAISMVFANTDVHLREAHHRDDHISELFGASAFICQRRPPKCSCGSRDVTSFVARDVNTLC